MTVDLRDITILIGTYGDGDWADLARDRAVPSAAAQGARVLHVHADTLHDARNQALEDAQTDWVAYLDADDELEPGYLGHLSAGTADVRVPSVRYIRPNGRARAPYVPRVAGHGHNCTADCLVEGNYIVVGALTQRDLVRRIGGWRAFSWSEDWDVWLRCYLAGATFETIPAAIYRAHVRPDSRNRAPTRDARLAAHEAIWQANIGTGA